VAILFRTHGHKSNRSPVHRGVALTAPAAARRSWRRWACRSAGAGVGVGWPRPPPRPKAAPMHSAAGQAPPGAPHQRHREGTGAAPARVSGGDIPSLPAPAGGISPWGWLGARGWSSAGPWPAPCGRHSCTRPWPGPSASGSPRRGCSGLRTAAARMGLTASGSSWPSTGYRPG
jgi:hypothetical protein